MTYPAPSEKPRQALFVHSANEMYGADIILLGLLQGCPPDWSPRVILPNDVHYEGRFARKLAESEIPYRVLKLAVLRRRYLSPVRFPQYLAYFAYSTASIIRQIRRESIQIVHSNTTAVIPGAVAARLTRRPHVWHSHEMVVNPKFLRRMTARIAPALSDIVITVSGAVRDHMLQDNPKASNIRVLHNGIDTARYESTDSRQRIRQEFGFTDSDVVVGTLARISRGKGQTYLIEAAGKIGKTHPNVKYLLVGDAFVGQEGLVDQLKAVISEQGLDDRVVLTGYRQDAPEILSAIDICALPSTLPDSFPTVVLEAMASGKPLIATNWGGSCEMVVDDQTGYLIPIDDADAFADRIARLANSPDLRNKMGQAGRQRVNELFTRDRMVRQFWDLMQEVLISRSK